jgi:hypothetical protein
MSEQTMSPPAGSVRPQVQAGESVPAAVETSRVSGVAASDAVTEAAGTAPRTAGRTPARPVLWIALVLFVPAVMLVLDGNLSVQTALVRFAAALLVSWAAARLVWATVRSGSSGSSGTEAAAGSGAVGMAADRTAPTRTG